MIRKNRKEFRKIAGFCLSYAVLLLQSDAMEKMEEKAAKIQLHETLKIRVDNYYQAQRAWKELKQPPEFRNNIIDLTSVSENFLHTATEERKSRQQEKIDIQKFGETVVNLIGYLGEEIIDNKVKNHEAKIFFLGIIDNAKKRGLSFFKE